MQKALTCFDPIRLTSQRHCPARKIPKSNIFLGGERNTPWVVTNLLAGIVFVDWLAVAPILPHWQSAVTVLGLFGLTKWFQRFVPAT